MGQSFLIIFPQFQPADLVAVNFVRSIGETQRAGVGVGAGQAEIVRYAAAAMRLNRPVDDLASMFGAATLIIAISARAPLLPTVSIR